LKPAAIAQADFFSWNPALSPTAKVIPPGYRVKIPPEKVDGFLAAQRHLTRRLAVAKSAAISKSLMTSVKQRSAPINDKVTTKKIKSRHTATVVATRVKARRLARARVRLAAQQLKLAER
jgi:hypothetical protein